MSSATQLKAKIRNLSKAKNISAQIIMQNYMLERLLERISLSPYQSNFILKGGFLIAAIVGLDTRATMDIDATLQGLPVNPQVVTEMFTKICQIPIDDQISFTLKRTEEIRNEAKYTGVRLSLEAHYPPMVIPLKLDITTGDKITPKEIEYQFNLLLEPRSIKILAYNLETVLAEKLETIISRGDQNTRPRDYYDIYIIHKLQWQNINLEVLKQALSVTAENRNSMIILERYTEILESVAKSNVMNQHWLNYQNQFDYAKSISFEEICQTLKIICELVLPV